MNKRYDKPIPLGWYAIEYSKKLKPGEVKPLRYFDRELVLFRNESGEATLLDAYCPHLGAHLGHGGKVDGAGIRCPFHAWQFDGRGHCMDIPYAQRMPPKIEGQPVIHSYPLVERNQMIWAWYHPHNAEPGFDVETIEEIGSPDWTELDTYEWTINSIIQETGENAVDIAHFVAVHSVPDMPVAEVTIDGHVRCTAMHTRTHALDESGHIDRSGENLEDGRLLAYAYGPGQTVQKFTRMFEIVMLGTITPIDSQSLHMRFNFTLPKAQTGEHTLYAHAFRDEIVRQVNQDIPIWEHKTYLNEPTLCDGDGPIAKYRRWFQQFYAA